MLLEVGQCGCASWSREYATMTVRCFDGCAAKNEDDQQQTEPTFKRGAVVLESADQHAGHCQLC